MIVFDNNYSAYKKLCEIIEINKFTSIVVLCDSNTNRFCLDVFRSSLFCSSLKIEVIEIQAGEQNKNIETCLYIWGKLLSFSCDRNSLIINLGGGIVSDIGGFVASTYKRGINYVNIPTTLLAMVDASIGNKTGVDFNGLKNVIGTFHSPVATIIDARYLTTLSFNEKLNGLAEMLKHGLIASQAHWIDISKQSIESISVNHISSSISIKDKIVCEDPNEKSLRKVLNFGHTIGHAIETFFLNKKEVNIGHGKAVAAGILMESYLSFKHNKLSKNEHDIIQNVITEKFAKIEIADTCFSQIADYTLNDKKNTNKQIKLVMLKEIGSAEIDNCVIKSEIVDALMYYSKI